MLMKNPNLSSFKSSSFYKDCSLIQPNITLQSDETELVNCLKLNKKESLAHSNPLDYKHNCNEIADLDAFERIYETGNRFTNSPYKLKPKNHKNNSETQFNLDLSSTRNFTPDELEEGEIRLMKNHANEVDQIVSSFKFSKDPRSSDKISTNFKTNNGSKFLINGGKPMNDGKDVEKKIDGKDRGQEMLSKFECFLKFIAQSKQDPNSQSFQQVRNKKISKLGDEKLIITIDSSDQSSPQKQENEEQIKKNEIRKQMELEIDMINEEDISDSDCKYNELPHDSFCLTHLNHQYNNYNNSTLDFLYIPLCESISRIDPRKKDLKLAGHPGKLNLVIDLDQTIINSHTFPRDFNISLATKHIPSDLVHIITAQEQKMLIIVHPYASKFLKKTSRVYNIYVYSHERYGYVKSILEILDGEKLFINRDIIFKNYGQASRTTPKLLSNLGFSSEEIKRTLILDSQKQVWERDHNRVVCTKKFIPLKQFMKDEKYNRYMLFMNEKDSKVEEAWLVNESNRKELNHYSQITLINSKTCQLNSLTSFLERSAEEYYMSNPSLMEVNETIGFEQFYGFKLQSILKNTKIAVISCQEKRVQMFEELAKKLGATLAEPEKAHYLLADESLESPQEILLHQAIERNPLSTVLSIYWLTECFFNLSKVKESGFLCRRFMEVNLNFKKIKFFNDMRTLYSGFHFWLVQEILGLE